MPKPLVAANWKMHGSKAMVTELLNAFRVLAQRPTTTEIVLFPPYLYLPQVSEILTNNQSRLLCGGQNLSEHPNGAFTGEISAEMLLEFNCQYVLIGHSEPRQHYGESDARVAAKFRRAIQASIQPIVCVGESLTQYENHETKQVVAQQLDAILESATSAAEPVELVVAYEPVWAIGTGKTATPEQAQEVHAFIRDYIAKCDEKLAESARILYGGSVNAENAAQLLAMPDIHGVLVGGASLKPEQFIEVCEAAAV